MSEQKISDKFKIIDPKSDIDKLLYKYCTYEFRKGFVEIEEENVVMPIKYKDIADDIENFEVRDTDIWIVTFPKSGTTWTQEMMWMIVNDLDFEGAKAYLEERFIFLETQCLFDFDLVSSKYPNIKIPASVAQSVREAKNVNNPRLIKTHLPWYLLPRALREGTTGAKMVYVSRNPKDTCVSFYHHSRLIDGYKGSFEEFCKLFLAGKVYYGSYWNMLDFWNRKDASNILFIKFEDMKRDLSSIIQKVSDFLIGKQLTEEQLVALDKHLSFENMKNNPSVNYERALERNKLFLKSNDASGKFMRAGTVGSYKAEMSPEIEKEFDKWIEENMKDANIVF